MAGVCGKDPSGVPAAGWVILGMPFGRWQNVGNMLIRQLLDRLGAVHKSRLRDFYYGRKDQFIQRFFSYGPEELENALIKLGVRNGDTVLLHSSFKHSNGFRGSAEAVIDIFLGAVGADGNLLMVSLPYLSSTYEYLRTLQCFNVRHTVSRMGLISEIFRRRHNVLRSLHPTHPVLACGPKANWIIAGHEHCMSPCGAGTPFEKLLLLNGKVVFFDAPFATFTFFHYLEDLLVDRLPFPLYYPDPFEVDVIDDEGRRSSVKTLVFSPEVIRRRRFKVLEDQLAKERLIRATRIGNTHLLSIEVVKAVECSQNMFGRGTLFYDLSCRAALGSSLSK